MHSMVAWQMRDGSKISFRIDSWLPCGLLITLVGEHHILQIEFEIDISLKDIYESNIWHTYSLNIIDHSIR